ncbi:kinase-like domain-containing protein, partial [Cladochytrium replicatum]
FSRRYRVTSELGCGGFGLVVSAQVIEEFSEKHLSRGEEVAVKFILKNRVDDNSWIEDRDLGFVPMEVHVLKAIKHENVIRFLDFYEDEVFVYLVMELHGTGWTNVSAAQSQFNHLRVNISGSQLPSVKRDDKFCYAETAAANKSNSLSINSGPSLQRAQSFPTTLERRPSMDLFECIERHEGTITEEQARFVFVQVLRAVSYMHNRGLVHRDIKDENIVVDEDFNVKMIDFGSATVDLDPSEYHNRFFGTLQYAPPEILRGERYRARPADVWCCGVLLYALLFGDTPFTSSDQAISRPFCSPPIRILRRLRDPRSVLALLNWMLQKSPRRRPSVQEILYHPW